MTTYADKFIPDMEMNKQYHIQFSVAPNTRAEDGGFKYDNHCYKCGQQSSCLLGIQVNGDWIVLCKNCLTEGIGMIDKEILSQLQR